MHLNAPKSDFFLRLDAVDHNIASTCDESAFGVYMGRLAVEMCIDNFLREWIKINIHFENKFTYSLCITFRT